jgi:hypothetical protein
MRARNFRLICFSYGREFASKIYPSPENSEFMFANYSSGGEFTYARPLSDSRRFCFLASLLILLFASAETKFCLYFTTQLLASAKTAVGSLVDVNVVFESSLIEGQTLHRHIQSLSEYVRGAVKLEAHGLLFGGCQSRRTSPLHNSEQLADECGRYVETGVEGSRGRPQQVREQLFGRGWHVPSVMQCVRALCLRRA